MTSEIDKLKHFHIEDYSGTNFTDDLNDGEKFLYTTIGIKDDKEVTFLFLLIMELEEKVKELIKWYMDTYGVNKDQAVRDIESVMLRIRHK
jgi:hypothetical protein